MPHPVNTDYFDVLPAGTGSIVDLNHSLGNLSYYIAAIINGDIAVGGVTGVDTTAGVSMTALDTAYLNPSDNKIYPIDANAAPAAAGTVRGFVQSTVSAEAAAVLVVSGILGGFTGLTPYQLVYADTSGDGTYTQTRPAPSLDAGQIAIVQMGIAISATEVFVMPGFLDNRVRYQKRYSPALDETTTIEHGRNLSGFGRKYAAYVTQQLTLTEYGSANQDSDVQLQGQNYAGETESSGAQTGSFSAIGDSGGSEFRSAQSFQLANGGRLSQFKFTLVASGGSPVGDMGWQIRTDSGGSGPTNAGTSVLASGTIPNASVVPSAVNTVNVTNGPVLSPSTTYWIVLIANSAQSSNVAWRWDADTTPTYADGQGAFSSNAGTSWTQDGRDHTFEVTVAAITANDKLSQGIQISSVDTAQSVKLWLKKVGSPTGNLTVKIQTDNAGSPSGTTITNGTSNTVAASSLATSYGWITFTFSTPPSLSAGTQYHIVLETADSQSNTNYVVWGADGSSPSYSSGDMKRERSAVWSSEAKDASFQVVGDGVDYINPVMVDWWSSTKADLVAQAGDSGGSNVATNTTFKCKAAAGFSDLTVEVTL
jgi:hypothetical protein